MKGSAAGSAHNATVSVINGTGDDGTAALIMLMRERHAWDETLVHLEATPKEGNDEKIANAVARLAELDEQIAALRG